MESWCFLNCGVIAPGFCLANLIPLAEANGNSYEECMLLNLYISTIKASMMNTYTLQLNRQDMNCRLLQLTDIGYQVQFI
jgi:hypothetical protein